MAKSHLTLDEALLVELCGDAIRSDVFPGRHDLAKTLTVGNPTDSFYFVDNKGKTILLFRLEQNKVTSIYSPRSSSEVLRFVDELASVDPDLSEYLKSLLTSSTKHGGELGEVQIKGDELIFKPYSSRLTRVLEYDRGKNDEALEVLLSYGLDRLPVSKKSTYEGGLSKVVTVVQKEYAVISGKLGEKKVANTFGLADCIGLVLYDKDNQVALVAHIDGGTDIVSSIPQLINDLSEAGGRNYHARLFGGYKSSAKQLVELIDGLREHGIKIVEADVLEGARSRAIGISTDGILYNNVFDDGDPTMADRMRIAGVSMNVPLKCHYKPR